MPISSGCSGSTCTRCSPTAPLPEHIAEQLSQGRTVLVEIDAWYLPDTEGTSYRRGHLKTTVAPTMIDHEAEWLRYFHNAGLFELSGEDYRGAFRMLDHFTDDVMDPFTEIVIFDAGPRLEGDELRAAARDLLAYHFARRPAANPFGAWAQSLAVRPAAAARRQPRGLPRVRVRDGPDGRLGVRAAGRQRRVDARRGRRGRRGRVPGDRRGDEGRLVSTRPPAPVRHPRRARAADRRVGARDGPARADARRMSPDIAAVQLTDGWTVAATAPGQ